MEIREVRQGKKSSRRKANWMKTTIESDWIISKRKNWTGEMETDSFLRPISSFYSNEIKLQENCSFG